MHTVYTDGNLPRPNPSLGHCLSGEKLVKSMKQREINEIKCDLNVHIKYYTCTCSKNNFYHLDGTLYNVMHITEQVYMYMQYNTEARPLSR